MDKDYGADPLGNGTFRMVPTGDVVDLAERNRRLARPRPDVHNDCVGLSWEKLQRMQGGKLRHEADTPRANMPLAG